MRQSKLSVRTLLDTAMVMSAIAALSFSTTQIASLDRELQLDVYVQPTGIRVQVIVGRDKTLRPACESKELYKVADAKVL